MLWKRVSSKLVQTSAGALPQGVHSGCLIVVAVAVQAVLGETQGFPSFPSPLREHTVVITTPKFTELWQTKIHKPDERERKTVGLVGRYSSVLNSRQMRQWMFAQPLLQQKAADINYEQISWICGGVKGCQCSDYSLAAVDQWAGTRSDEGRLMRNAKGTKAWMKIRRLCRPQVFFGTYVLYIHTSHQQQWVCSYITYYSKQLTCSDELFPFLFNWLHYASLRALYILDILRFFAADLRHFKCLRRLPMSD